ncbi:MAG: U32 family peptidase [Thermodesulfovibrionales bacterium]|nr:U32 family peptidase [Nitrospinota bacterium]MCG2710124.1 U32 family peptidase [Thermodesulfovibrionales bacterium]
MKKPELLAPAGDFEKLRTAIHYGADAVYLGDSRFSLRGKAGNFEPEELKEAISYAHARNKKAYVTANIFPHNTDLKQMEEYIGFLKDAMPDAVILSDPGFFMMFKKSAPEIATHVSTQANITNSEAARFWENLGAKRLVLSRELTIDEIKEIRSKVKIELEVFVHGSICISYSGRCYISSFLASRSANRGECTNSCRWNYTLMEEKRQGEHFPVFEDDRGTYIMSSKDLCMIEHLHLLIDAGIDSFKIEGRMKGINYVAGVVKTYSEAVDSLGNGKYAVNPRWLRELSMFSSRGYTTGMFFGKQPDNDYNFDGESYRMSHELVGIILEIKDGIAKVELRNRLDMGDAIEYLSPGLEEKLFALESMKDADGMDITTARNENIVFMPVPVGVRPNDLIRRAKNFRRASSYSG